MMCDILPTISEDSISQRSGQFTGDEANFEQLMVNMLDERDKLMETLRENQDQLSELRGKTTDVEKERDSLQRQLHANLPQVRSNFIYSHLSAFSSWNFTGIFEFNSRTEPGS